ncbi:DUF6053 domain-containing protein [Lysobacter enzymogenes]|uniref:DUF6053 domain-containing protein n=1 Tax=Lysobacter enzymogenes TaxID=69 RepID=UPI003D18A54D
MGGASAPTLLCPIAAIRAESLGAEAPLTTARGLAHPARFGPEPAAFLNRIGARVPVARLIACAPSHRRHIQCRPMRCH